MAPDRGPVPAWARHQLDALARLDRARLVINAVLAGDWPPDPEIADAVAELVASASPHLRVSRELQAVA